MTKEEKLSIISYRVELSLSTIREVEVLLANKFLNNSMNRIYYAGFYIVSARAFIDGVPTSNHKKLIVYFNKNYIHTGKIDNKTGKIFQTSFDKRMAVDYGDFVTLTKSQIDEYRIAMTAFIDQVKFLIEEKIKTR